MSATDHPIILVPFVICIFFSVVAFFVTVIEVNAKLPDGEGVTTYQEAVANAETVIQDWIDTAHELGRSIPEPRGRLMYA
ncbi:MAG: type II toxin-antitoxin system HicB family antitoxin [Syntrophobacteraceae bacterium]